MSYKRVSNSKTGKKKKSNPTQTVKKRRNPSKYSILKDTYLLNWYDSTMASEEYLDKLLAEGFLEHKHRRKNGTSQVYWLSAKGLAYLYNKGYLKGERWFEDLIGKPIYHYQDSDKKEIDISKGDGTEKVKRGHRKYTAMDSKTMVEAKNIYEKMSKRSSSNVFHKTDFFSFIDDNY